MGARIWVYLSYDLKTTFKSRFCVKKTKILSYTHDVLIDLMHGFISLPNVTSHDKLSYPSVLTSVLCAQKDHRDGSF